MAEEMVSVSFINNQGGGFSATVEVAVDTSMAEFFLTHMEGQRASDFMIRVNREPVSQSYRLKEDDRISITPTKIEGAVA